jgi:hypothetical protein
LFIKKKKKRKENSNNIFLVLKKMESQDNNKKKEDKESKPLKTKVYFQKSDTNTTYLKKHNVMMEEYANKKVCDVFEKESALSDHTMQSSLLYANDITKVSIMWWNILNRKYIKYMEEVESRDNQLLHDHFMASPDEKDQNERENSILLKLKNNMADVMCLQEVSMSMYMKLTGISSGKYDIYSSRCSKPDSTGYVGNRNVTIVSREKFERTLGSRCFYPEGQFESTCFIPLTLKGDSEPSFNVLNVHLPWNDGVDYPKLMLAHDFGNIPTVVAGDFNLGVRQDPTTGKAGMSVYESDRFIFPALEYLDLPFSHVCPLKNVKSEAEMLDKFDHIMIVAPPQ